jgi:cytochrome c oxidase cbb3-type subunit 1
VPLIEATLRTVAGVSMDIGMTLLVIDLMMTALARPARASEPAFGAAPIPAGGAA